MVVRSRRNPQNPRHRRARHRQDRDGTGSPGPLIGAPLFHGLAVFAAVLLAAAPVARAADAPPGISGQPAPAGHPDRALQITPYLWAAGLDGTISPFRLGPSIGVEKSFPDVLEDLDFGGFVNLWGRQGRFVVLGDLMYVETTDSQSTGPLPALSIPGVGVIPPGGDIAARVNSRQFTATVMGGYRVLESPQFTLDALGGVRLWQVSTDVRLTGSLGGLSGSVRHSESFGWLDPLVGLRAFVPVTERLSLQAQADIGGFGIGSDLTWSALATANYVLGEHLSVSAGYKVLDVDYDHDGHVFDTRLSGPVLGVTYRF